MMRTSKALSLKSLLALVAMSAAMLSAHAAEYVVKFKSEKGLLQFTSEARTQTDAGKVIDQHLPGKLVTYDIPNTRSQANTLKTLFDDPRVEYVVDNFEIKAFELPNDPELSKQWSVDKVNAAAAWAQHKGDRKVVVAVIDTGVNYNHEDLRENAWRNPGEVAGNGKDDDGNGFVDDVYGYDFAKNDSDPMDIVQGRNPGTGTRCAGIVGGTGDKGNRISGMSQQA